MALHSGVGRRSRDTSRHRELVKKVEQFDDAGLQPELRGGQQLEMADHLCEILVYGKIRSHLFQKQYSALDPRHAYGALNNGCRQVVTSNGCSRQKRLLIECLGIENQPVHVEDHGDWHMRKRHFPRIVDAPQLGNSMHGARNSLERLGSRGPRHHLTICPTPQGAPADSSLFGVVQACRSFAAHANAVVTPPASARCPTGRRAKRWRRCASPEFPAPRAW